MKPLSQKTLEKKYAELGLSQKNIALLHDYYNCFANLYGIIMVKEAWDIFRHYEGVGLLHKKRLRRVLQHCAAGSRTSVYDP